MINVLIVEDDAVKSARIAASLESSEIAISFQTATNVVDAKARLQKLRFDFMLLDINLPKRATTMAEKDGGFEVLRWLTTRGANHRPAYVIGMTSDEDTYSNALEANNSLLWQIVKYDRHSSDWSDKLMQTIIDMQPAIKPPYKSDGSTYKTDILIVTALQDPELSEVLKLPCDFKKIDVPHDASSYYQGKLWSGAVAADVIAVHASDKGLSGAAIAATKAIMTFWPRYVFMTGITAGVKGRTNIGDIIFADLSWDWGSGKIKNIKKEDVFLPAPYQRRLDETLSRNVKEFTESRDDIKQMHELYTGVKPSVVPRAIIGVMASGASVLQSQPAVKKVIAQHKDLLAIEMEAFSVMFAAQTSPQPRPLVVVAKAVSDAGDIRKNDHYQKYAAHMSARAFYVFAQRFLLSHLENL